MVHVHGVVLPVTDSPPLYVLAPDNEGGETPLIYPMRAPQHGQRRKAPPRVADVGEFLRTTIESARGGLTLSEPPRRALLTGWGEEVGVGRKLESAHAHEC